MKVELKPQYLGHSRGKLLLFKQYEVAKEDSEFYYIVDEKGMLNYFSKARFKIKC